MAHEAVKRAEGGLRDKLERAAEESRSPVHPVYGWNDLKKSVSGLFKKSESESSSSERSDSDSKQS